MKHRVEDLALFGGPALFATPRPTGQLAAPPVEDYLAVVRGVTARRHLSNNGPLVRELERKLAALHGVGHCVAVANAALGLLMLLQILTPRRGGSEVIIPSFAYRALPHCARWAGLKPRFADVDPITLTLDPASVSDALNENTSCILAAAGALTPGHVSALSRIASVRRIPLVFDSSDAIACTEAGKPVGGFGDAEVFSLHATKLINGFEGGYITTNDGGLAENLSRQRDFNHAGADPRAPKGPEHVLGLNGKLNEFHAGMALLSLDRMDSVIAANEARYNAYAAAFAGITGVSIRPYPDRKEERRNFGTILMDVSEDWSLTRDQTVALMRAENAEARAYFSPSLHQLDPWREGGAAPALPVTTRLAERLILLPAGDLTSLEDVRAIADLAGFLGTRAQDIARRLNGGLQ